MNNLIASRKIVWPAAAVLIALWLLPTIVRSVRGGISAAVSRPAHGAAQQQVTPPPASPTALDAKPSPVIPLTPEDEHLRTLVGLWTGQELLMDRGICSLTFVLGEDPAKPGEYKGDTTGNCFYAPVAVNIPKPKNLSETMAYTYQTSAILSGTADKGVLHFTVDKVIGERCRPTGFTFTPFAAQLAA